MPPAYNRAMTAIRPGPLPSSCASSLYLTINPNGDSNNPNTFSSGQLIAIFKRGETLFDQIVQESHHVLSESLVSSQDFTNGETMNFR